MTEREMHEKNRDMKKAFEDIQATTHVQSDPLRVPIFQCFDWVNIFDKQRFTDTENFYVVAFRTVRKKEADERLLERTEAAVHEEAKGSGGLLFFWNGSPNARRERFSISIWESEEAEKAASQLPAHVEAQKLLSQAYDSYMVECYFLTGTAADSFPAFELVHANKSITN